MVLSFTSIARVTDGLVLAASTDDNASLTEYKNQAKAIFKRLTPQSESRCSIESGPYTFHYMIEYGVCYLVLAERQDPKRLAFAYLEELHREFHQAHGDEVDTAARPYAFMSFDATIQRTKRRFSDSRQHNLSKLNDDLQDVTRIMTTNIQDVLGRGEKLDKMTEMSQQLTSESRKYVKNTRQLNLQLLYRKYGPPLVVLLVVIIVLYVRFAFF